jgi:DNA-binding NarL/FixJ family response regulator
MKIKILLVDDHEIILDGIRIMIESTDNMKVVGVAKDGRSAVQQNRDLKPDVVVMDISMPNLNGIEASKQILSQNPQCKIIILSMHNDQKYINQALNAGVAGYLLKQGAFEELKTAIKTVMQDKVYLSSEIQNIVVSEYIGNIRQLSTSTVLTSREQEVLQLIAEGKAAKEMADILSISTKTIDVHRRNIMDKLNLRNTAELTKYAIREGIISA